MTTEPAFTKTQAKRFMAHVTNMVNAKRAEERTVKRVMVNYRALLWQLWRVEHDEEIVNREPREIVKTQLLKFRPPAPEPKTDSTNEDARDAAAVIAADPDAAEMDRDSGREEGDVRSTAERFAFRFHQKCRGRGYRVKAGRAVICKCAARKMAAYLRENDVAV